MKELIFNQFTAGATISRFQFLLKKYFQQLLKRLSNSNELLSTDMYSDRSLNRRGLFLYLIPFNDGKHFKLGITQSKDLSRIKKLNQIYDVNYEQSLLVSASKARSIQLLEKDLLNIFSGEVQKYKGKDGWTEVRPLSFFTDVIAEIKSRNSVLGLKIEPLNNYTQELNSKPVPYYKKKRKQISIDQKKLNFELKKALFNKRQIKNHVKLLLELKPYLVSKKKEPNQLKYFFCHVPNSKENNYLYNRVRNGKSPVLIEADNIRTPAFCSLSGNDQFPNDFCMSYRIVIHSLIFNEFINEVERTLNKPADK